MCLLREPLILAFLYGPGGGGSLQGWRGEPTRSRRDTNCHTLCHNPLLTSGVAAPWEPILKRCYILAQVGTMTSESFLWGHVDFVDIYRELVSFPPIPRAPWDEKLCAWPGHFRWLSDLYLTSP